MKVCLVESKQDEAGILENSDIPEVKKKKPAKEQETGTKEVLGKSWKCPGSKGKRSFLGGVSASQR